MTLQVSNRLSSRGIFYLVYCFFLCLPALSLVSAQAVSRSLFLIFAPFVFGISLIMLRREWISHVKLLFAIGITTVCLVLSMINGFDSIRLGVFSACFFALLVTAVRVPALVVWIGTVALFICIFNITGGFSRFVSKSYEFTAESSINIFGQVALYFITLSLLSRRGKSQIVQLCLLGAVCLVGAFFINSRQLLLIPVFALFSIYFLYLRRNLSFNLSVVFLFSLLPIQYELSELAPASFTENRFDSERWEIYRCFFERLDSWSIVFGGYGSSAGRCADDLIGVFYLHSAYLEFFVNFGFFAYFLTGVLLLGICRSALAREFDIFLILLFYSVYGLVESVGFWGFFIAALYLFRNKDKGDDVLVPRP
jgi:hypothetical protein